MKIAAVVVTFNRADLLIECLQGLLRQSRALDKIFVVDNCSSDDTAEKMAGFSSRYKNIAYRRLGSNTGGAGGFAAGIEWACSENFDWLWLMDDDVEPYSEGLEKLLFFADRSQCIHGLRTDPDGRFFPWGSHFDPSIVDTVPLSKDLLLQQVDAVEVNVGCFEGMLVHRSVIEQVGGPWPDLFITWDDTYFGYCASQVTNVLYAKVNSLKRKRSMDRVKTGLFGTRMSMTPMGNFFHHRNRYMLATRLKPNFLKFWTRNFLVYTKGLFKELFLRRSLVNAINIHRGTWAGLKYYWQAR